MVRTVISLSEDDKEWLDRVSQQLGVPMTQLVRDAVRLLRDQLSDESPSFEQLLEATSGIWRQGDGLAYQERLRDEW